MTGFRLMLKDNKGEYTNAGCAIIFEGSMLVYDPQRNMAQWLLVRGASAALTMTELQAANDLNNMVPPPNSKAELARPPSPEIMKGVPAGAESEMDSSAIDSGNEWGKTEVGMWQHCLTPTVKRGLTWVEVHATAQEEEVIQNQDSTWEDIIDRQSSGGTEEEDWGIEEDSQSAVVPQFEDAPIEEEEEEAPEVPADKSDEDTVEHKSQDAGEDNLQ